MSTNPWDDATLIIMGKRRCLQQIIPVKIAVEKVLEIACQFN